MSATNTEAAHSFFKGFQELSDELLWLTKDDLIEPFSTVYPDRDHQRLHGSESRIANGSYLLLDLAGVWGSKQNREWFAQACRTVTAGMRVDTRQLHRVNFETFSADLKTLPDVFGEVFCGQISFGDLVSQLCSRLI